MAISTIEFYRAHVGVEATLSLVILILGIFTWSAARHHHEPTRKGVNWLYLAFALLFLADVFGTVDFGLYLQVETKSLGDGFSGGDMLVLLEAQQRVDIFATFFRTVGACALLTCIAGMAAGIYQAHGARRAHIYYTIFGALSISVAILALAVFSGQQWLMSVYVRQSWSEYRSAEPIRKDMIKLHAVVDIILLVASLAVVGWVWVAVAKARKAAGNFRMLDRSVDYLIFAGLLNVVVRGWRMVNLAWSLGKWPRNNTWWSVTDLALDRVITVIILGLLSAVASRKASSLWQASKGDGEESMQQTYVPQPHQPNEQYA